MTAEEIEDALREVVDPELGVNIVDLGLIYKVEVEDSSVRVEMTMTTRACPLHAYLSDLARSAVQKRFPGVVSVEIKMVWEPAWNPSRMSEAARRQLGS